MESPSHSLSPPSFEATAEVASGQAAGTAVEDGITMRRPEIRLHRIDIFFDEDARRQAIKDGVMEKGEDLPNPVFVRDLEQSRTLSISRDALITLIGYDEHGSPTVVSMDFAEFRSVFAAGLVPPDWYGGRSG